VRKHYFAKSLIHMSAKFTHRDAAGFSENIETWSKEEIRL